MIKYILKQDNTDSRMYVCQSRMMLFHQLPQIALFTLRSNSDKTADLKRGLDETVKTKASVHQTETVEIGGKVDRGVQTLRREAQTQTDPYTPKESVESSKKRLEVLSLRHFKWGKELPPTIDELIFIEEQREKQMFDTALPPISDEFCFQLRRKLMEQQEIYEWQKKENDMKKNQNKKLNLLQNMLIEREKAIEQNNYIRVAAVKDDLNVQKNILVAKLQNRKIKAIRKLVKIEKEFQALKSKKTIIDEYQNFGSKVYANIMRNGFSLERFSERFKTDFKALSDYEVFKEFVSALDPGYRTVNVQLDELINNSTRKYLKLEKYQLQQLQKAQEELNNKKASKYAKDFEDMYDLNIQNVVPRPDTPYYEERIELSKYPHQEVNLDKTKMIAEEERIEKEDKRHMVATLLQRLLRGRAIQNIMFDGKEKRLALIDELLIVANTQSKNESEEEELLKRIKEHEEELAKQESSQGKVIANTLDLLNKELLKFIEEKKLKEFVDNAEEERRIREVTETGKRQAELIIKSREERFYSEAISVHKQTIEGLLDEVFATSSDFLSHKEATHLTTIKECKFVNYVEMNDKNYEVLIKDFLNCFLVPNIDKQKLRQQTRQNDMESYNRLMNNSTKDFSA